MFAQEKSVNEPGLEERVRKGGDVESSECKQCVGGGGYSFFFFTGGI